MTCPIAIVGAGLAGLIAGHAWPTAKIFERGPKPNAMHKALLRFRSDAVANATGIEFKQVQVRKGIWSEGQFVEPSIRVANQYARKCLGAIGADRSIWNIAPVQRFIAPDNFHEQLLAGVAGRVEYGVNAYDGRQVKLARGLISTAPLPAVAAAMGVLPSELAFLRAPIHVRQFDLGAHCDTYQTVYFPDEGDSMYRASITGRTLIVESVGEEGDFQVSRPAIEEAFGLSEWLDWTPLGEAKQQYGKIAPIDDATRKALLFRLTHEFDIYSLGRFATWRNILLDDVVQDIAVVKRLMKGGTYDLRRASGGPRVASPFPQLTKENSK